MSNGINVVVTAPRRYGKTSLRDRAARQLSDQGGSVIRANLLRTPSVEVLAGRLVGEAYQLTGGAWRRAVEAVPEFLRPVRLQPTVSFDAAGNALFSFAPSSVPRDAEQPIDDVYRILAELADRGPAVLVLDEFQAVADLSACLPQLLKALADEHPSVSFVLAGSRRLLMEGLALSQGAPLYNMAERLALGPIDHAVMCEFLVARTASARRSMDLVVAERVCALAGPIPHDIQRLAYEVFDISADEITERDVSSAMERAVAHEAEGYAERFSKLAIGHRRVLMVLARSEVTGPNRRSSFARPATPISGAARKAVQVLEDDETVLRRDAVYQVGDPLFRVWLRADR
jgi:uncharacterized protein